MFSIDCFAQLWKLILILICFNFLLDLLLSSRETAKSGYSFYRFGLNILEKTDKLNTVSI